MSKRLLITGGTGHQGGSVVNEALKRGGFDVLALTRTPDTASAKRLAAKGVKLVKGSFSDRDVLVEALRKVDAAFLVTYSMGPGGVEQEVKEGKKFIDAAVEARLGHLVFSSGGGVNGNEAVPHFAGKREIERYLEKSDLAFTIFRCVSYMDNMPKQPGAATFFGLGLFAAVLKGKPMHLLAVRDIGIRVVDAIQPLVGDCLTVGQMQDGYARVLGSRPWRAHFPGAVVRMLPYDFRKTMEYLGQGEGYGYDVKKVAEEVGKMTTFEEWLRCED